MAGKKRYVQVGVGSRSRMYSGAIVEKYGEFSELVGLCDDNEGRLRQRVQWAKENGIDIKSYPDEDFDRMIKETGPDTVIVTTKDCFHDKYIVRALVLAAAVIFDVTTRRKGLIKG